MKIHIHKWNCYGIECDACGFRFDTYMRSGVTAEKMAQKSGWAIMKTCKCFKINSHYCPKCKAEID